jgi:hypothetical protein
MTFTLKNQKIKRLFAQQRSGKPDLEKLNVQINKHMKNGAKNPESPQPLKIFIISSGTSHSLPISLVSAVPSSFNR